MCVRLPDRNTLSPAVVGPLPCWLSIINLTLFTYHPIILTSRLQASLSATVQSERSALFPRDARRGPAACSSSRSSKTCLLISYTTNAFPVRTIPLEQPLIAAHTLSRSSRVNMSLLVRH